MSRRASIGLLALVVVAFAFAGWTWRENRALRDRLAQKDRAAKDTWAAAPAAGSGSPGGEGGSGGGQARRGFNFPGLGRKPGGPLPTIETTPSETRMERRLRRQNELAAMLGRDPDESEEDYKARILPLMDLALSKPRKDLADLRRAAEDKAGVTEAQRAELDQAFAGIYDEVVAYTDSAVADGQLTPYDRNVKGLLQYAGGLGAILEGAEGKVGGILSPEQVRTIHDSGFEWGEYLGVSAPWERLRVPPVRPQ